MQLPRALDDSYWQEIRSYEEGFAKGVEEGKEQGIQQGVRQGLLAGIELGLELKFGPDGLRILPEIRKTEDEDRLRAIHEGLKIATSLDELRHVYRTDKNATED